MKRILFLLAFMATVFTSFGQTFNAKGAPALPFNSVARGNYGTYVGIGYITGTICTIVQNTVTPTTHADTLVSPPTGAAGYKTDTGYAQFAYNFSVNRNFDLSIALLSGTLAGTAVLQGSYDNSTWYTLTGNTTYCASCKGASATLSGTGTSDYQWYVPDNAENFPYHQLAVYMTGTCTATFSVKNSVSY